MFLYRGMFTQGSGGVATMNETKSPYPGIRPFRTDESDIFFGREDSVDKLSQLQNSNKIGFTTPKRRIKKP